MSMSFMSFASAVCIAALSLSAHAGGRGLEILFADADDGFAITGIVNRVNGEVRFGGSDGCHPDFWELKFRTMPGGSNVTCYISNRASAQQRIARVKGDVRTFIWKGVDLPGEPGVLDVRADLRYATDGVSAEWTIRTANRSARWALASTHYPYLHRVLVPGEGDALVPSKNLGARFIRGFDATKLRNMGYEYPGWYPMVTAFQKESSGLYVAAHDPDARIKSLWYTKSGGLYFDTPVENASILGAAAGGPRYPVVMTAYSGDWWTAAHIYRKWALKQKWCAKGPIAKRTDYPRAMSDTAIWGKIRGTPGEVRDFVRKAMVRWSDVKVGFRWYSWNLQPYDTHYPEFLPCRGVDAECARAREAGYLMMPYVNGRIWDAGLRSFRYASRDCCTKLIGGGPEYEQYGRTFGVMCPAAVDWQRTLYDMAVNALEGTGANALYMDQITCTRPLLCYNPDHGHPLGGGSWWSDGYRKALEPIHERLSKAGIPLTSEGDSEVWMDVVDGHLVVGRMGLPGDVPFYPAVYSGHTTYFCIEEMPTDSVSALFARQAQGVLFGSVCGSWADIRLFGSKGKDSLDAQCRVLHALARLRTAFGDYLAYGTLEDELRCAETLPTVTYSYAATRVPPGRTMPDTALSYPAVLGSVWKGSDGMSTALFAANVSSERRTVKVRVPQGLSAAAKAVPVPDQPPATFVRKGAFGLLTLEPFSIGVVR